VETYCPWIGAEIVFIRIWFDFCEEIASYRRFAWAVVSVTVTITIRERWISSNFWGMISCPQNVGNSRFAKSFLGPEVSFNPSCNSDSKPNCASWFVIQSEQRRQRWLPETSLNEFKSYIPFESQQELYKDEIRLSKKSEKIKNHINVT